MGKEHHIGGTSWVLAFLVVRLLGFILRRPGKERYVRAFVGSEGFPRLWFRQLRIRCKWNSTQYGAGAQSLRSNASQRWHARWTHSSRLLPKFNDEAVTADTSFEPTIPPFTTSASPFTDDIDAAFHGSPISGRTQTGS